MDPFPDIKLIDLPKETIAEIINITQRCWGQAAWYLDEASHEDFLLFYGFRRDVVDFSLKYFCDKYYEFAVMRMITTTQLVNAFYLARRRDICYRIRNILMNKHQATDTPASGLKAEIEQLKETVRCRDKEILLFVEAVNARDEKIKNMSTIVAQLRDVVSGVANIVL